MTKEAPPPETPGAEAQQAGVKRRRVDEGSNTRMSDAEAVPPAPNGKGDNPEREAVGESEQQKSLSPSAAAAEGEGGHVLGNFPRYYDFHPAAPRLQPLLGSKAALDLIFTPDVLAREELTMADLGCNDGTLTLLLQKELRGELQRRLGEGKEGRVGALGVDIDEELVNRARMQRAEEEEEEEGGAGGGGAGETRFEAADLGDEEDRLAPLRQAFFSSLSSPDDGPVFDLLTVMSTTMWVHLNHGDGGLERFLRRAASSSSSILIEPQDWSSYKSAQRRLKRLGLRESPHYQKINRSPTALIRRVLVDEEGFRVMNLGKTSSWQRDLLLFHRPPPNDNRS